ncbi:MAG TPA: HD domain-containing phosphohydrolase [Actinomycetota bacterium]|nr:HD domain-containing phosphohydrolase [Actinomycetota bacterium]
MKLRFFEDAHILVVDDVDANTYFLERILTDAGYVNIETVNDARQVLPVFETFQPDIVLLDIRMPHLDGFDVMHQLMARMDHDTPVPIIVLTADLDPDKRLQALTLGAKDFVTKPFDKVEVRLRIMNQLETRALQLRLNKQRNNLEEEVSARTKELNDARLEMLERLALAAEYRDDATGQHALRVGSFSAVLASALELPDEDVECIRKAAQLHDIGKIGIPDHILQKPGRLTHAEFAFIKRHTDIGARILSGSTTRLLQMAEDIALSHHERWDGTGYAGLPAKHVPICARIVAVADAFDAMTHDRPYRKALPPELAAAEIKNQNARQFDPDVVDAFLRTESLTGLHEVLAREVVDLTGS